MQYYDLGESQTWMLLMWRPAFNKQTLNLEYSIVRRNKNVSFKLYAIHYLTREFGVVSTKITTPG